MSEKSWQVQSLSPPVPHRFPRKSASQSPLKLAYLEGPAWLCPSTYPLDRPVLIAGPTASGKSASGPADRRNPIRAASIINADALQVFDNWRVLSARPSEAKTKLRVPHQALWTYCCRLKSIPPVNGCGRSRPLLATVSERPIIVGGTGLYFRSADGRVGRHSCDTAT